ncbi:HNH endonuclease signature motif containing protein [Microbacterium sp. SS28]|uniref:HNH endonuclease signature motif containing protein n=1 Tax=Microbacterium sp. SS28 TaxID=2919948 RepID=UPI001FAA58B5|nr:HNH endonuclease signature motif containing protein [Microbacterium sp. SS28]
MDRSPVTQPLGDIAEPWEADLAGLELAAFDAPDALDLVMEVDAMLAICAAQRLERVDAMRREALGDAARYGGGLRDVIERSVRLELAAALRITEHSAATLLSLAEALVSRYPTVLASLGAGRMTERHATTIVDYLDAVEAEVRAGIVDRAVELAEVEAVGTFRRSLRRLVDSVRASTLAERYEAALVQRRVYVEPAEDGAAWLHYFGPAVEVHAAHGRITAMAKVLCAQPGDTRTLDQARADVLCDLLIDGTTADHPVEARGIRATVVVTVPVLSLLEGADGSPDDLSETEHHADRGGITPAGLADLPVVEGIGPIPLAVARELCGGASGWMRVLTHPETGAVLSVGREQYRPPSSLARLVRWRADRCMAPGCGMPASRCEIDHSIAWQHGGCTSITNLDPLCKGHREHGRGPVLVAA